MPDFDWRVALDTLSTRDPYSPDYWVAGPGQEWHFRKRASCAIIDVAHDSDFDRWANSVIASFPPPKTRRAWGKWVRRLEDVRRIREPDRPGRKDRARHG